MSEIHLEFHNDTFALCSLCNCSCICIFYCGCICICICYSVLVSVSVSVILSANQLLEGTEQKLVNNPPHLARGYHWKNAPFTASLMERWQSVSPSVRQSESLKKTEKKNTSQRNQKEDKETRAIVNCTEEKMSWNWSWSWGWGWGFRMNCCSTGLVDCCCWTFVQLKRYYCVPQWLTNWLTGWLIDTLTDWRIDKPSATATPTPFPTGDSKSKLHFVKADPGWKNRFVTPFGSARFDSSQFLDLCGNLMRLFASRS